MCFHWVASFGFDGANIRKENLFLKKKKKKKRLSEEDEMKEECYRFADTWVVLEEEWKELNKKWDDIYFNSGKKKKKKLILAQK